eukprot:4925005-Amphidinium_carterae.1
MSSHIFGKRQQKEYNKVSHTKPATCAYTPGAAGAAGAAFAGAGAAACQVLVKTTNNEQSVHECLCETSVTRKSLHCIQHCCLQPEATPTRSLVKRLEASPKQLRFAASCEKPLPELVIHRRRQLLSAPGLQRPHFNW